jgi:hypothetical protein
MEFGKTLNDEGSKCQKNTLEDEGKTITGKAACLSHPPLFLW